MHVMVSRRDPNIPGEHRDYISPKSFPFVGALLQVAKEATGLPQL